MVCGGAGAGFSTSSLGMALALVMAASMIFSGYCLSKKRFSFVLYSLQILVILRACENGIFSGTWAGWHELVKRYWFLSVGLRYKSVITLPFFIVQLVSKNGIESLGLQPQGCTWLFSLVCDIVNFMLGLILFISSTNLWRSITGPVNIKKISSKKPPYNFIIFVMS